MNSSRLMLAFVFFAASTSSAWSASAFEQLFYAPRISSEIARSGNAVYLIDTTMPYENNRIHLYDVTNPAKPVYRGYWRMDDVKCGPAAVVGNRLVMAGAYGANGNGCLLVFDISDPTTMTLKKMSVCNQSCSYGDIEIHNGYAYLADWMGFDVWSLANVDSPQYIKEQYYDAGGTVQNLDAENGLLYLSTGYVYSLANPANPKYFFKESFYNKYNRSCEDIVAAGDIVYAALTNKEPYMLVSFGRDGDRLVELSSIVLDGPPDCIRISGDFLFASGLNFLVAVDIRRPDLMRKLDTAPNHYWTNRMSIDGDIIYATSGFDGFRVWRYNGKLYNATESPWMRYE